MYLGDTTHVRTTLSIATLCLTTNKSDTQHNGSVVKLNVVMPSVIVLRVVAPLVQI